MPLAPHGPDDSWWQRTHDVLMPPLRGLRPARREGVRSLPGGPPTHRPGRLSPL